MDSKIGNTCNVKHLIVDSAGFLKNTSLKDIGEEIYTIDQVVSEIRDRETRSRLQVLPYELKFRTPSSEAIKFVTDFSKRTGDYASLSPVDIKVIALTFQIHKEHGDTNQIRSEPNKNVVIETNPKHTPVPKGFYFEKNYDKNNKENSDKNDNDCSGEELAEELGERCSVDVNEVDKSREEDDDNDDQGYHNTDEDGDDEWFSSEDFEDDTETDVMKHEINSVGQDLEDQTTSFDKNDDDDEKENNDEINSDDEDDEGWITPKNIASFRKTLPNQPVLPSEPVQVACLTTDFAMQNVLIQMGLNIVSMHGLLIKHVRNYVLKCSACFKVTKDVSKVFCHHCGNQTLQKLSMTINDDGSVIYHVPKNRQPNIRGLRYALPTPKGGRHAHNPILSSDQLTTSRKRSSKKQLDPLHPDYIAREQPFSVHALNTRGISHVVKNWDVQPTVGKRKNPNESGRCKGKKKG